MPTKSIPPRDGKPRWARLRYRASDYSVPQKVLDDYRTSAAPMGSEELLDTYGEGGFDDYREIRRFERDGKRWIVLVHKSLDWGLEVELTRGRLGAVEPVPPEEAWRLAREKDAIAGVMLEGEPEAP